MKFAFTLLLMALVAPERGRAAEIAIPDYGQSVYWTQGALAPLTQAPQGMANTQSGQAVDVFLVHPTTTRSATAFNPDPLDLMGSKWTDESAVQRQHQANALAYGNVARAFDWYLAHENKGRPLILAGHSEGAAHVASLLASIQ
ncbi:hypothetical protein IP81_14370 [Novosphingobium sp. AAP83]|uniref:DUF3089 domain-containing protein n=1 Tax=Novosphingobium sp. AAP83 TaxID=1523425 RepID=UPI0006B968C4|nr:DUF3089 domain-containing protein [Novosphingobium sp. AAP83]KPF90832.1 hypothetical protein IP81_14370 [Novosphingobium sp. AAP83]